MVFTFAVSVMAADYSDTENHWANAQIEKWSDEGILQGSDGKFRPSDSITRGEMAIILDRIMDYQVKAKNSFGDLASEAYFTDAILKANASGVILGDAGKVRPKDYITREEAAVMLGRAFGLTASANASSNFTDKANVASWASAMVLTMEQKGFIGGTDGKFLPKNNISRAEVVKIVDNIIKGFVTKAGTYTANVEGTLVVNAPNVILKGITIGGDLVVAPGVGEGEITLDNVTVKGNLVVKGGGVNSIVIKGNSDIGKVLVTKVGNQVRVVTEGNADVEIVVVDDGSDDVVLTGSFGDVQVNASDVVVKAVDASITNAKIEGTKSKVVLDAKSTVNTLTLSAAGAEVSGDKGAVVKSVVAESTAKGAEITGNITVEKAEVKANNVAVNTVGTKVTVSAGVTGTTSNGNTVNAGTTVTTTTTAPSTSTGSGGGGGSSTPVARAVKAAPLHDNAGAGSDITLATYTATATKNSDGIQTITITATNVPAHENTNNTAGWWVGVGIVAPAGVDWTKVTYSGATNDFNTTLASAGMTTADKFAGDTNDYFAIYVDAIKNPAKLYWMVDWDGDGTAQPEKYVFNIANVTVNATAAEVATGITAIKAPVKDATSLTLPTVPSGYTVAIKTSDKTDLIALNGTIVPPVVQTTVVLTLEITKTADGTKESTGNISVVVPAKTPTAVTASASVLATATGSTTITLGQVITGLATGDIVVKKDGTALTDVTDYALTGLGTTSVGIAFTASAGLTNASVITVEMTKAGYTINGGAAIAVTNNIPAPADIADLTIAVGANGAITGDTATAAGTLKYLVVAATKATEIAAWNVDTLEADANTALGGTLSTTKPTLTSTDNTKFLVVVEVSAGGKVVAAGQSAAIAITPPPISLAGVGVNVAAGNITATAVTMQYSLDSTNGTDGTWTDCTADNTAVTFVEGKVYVREKANTTNSRLVATIAAAAAAPALVSNDTENTITGLDNTYEYKIDAGAWTSGEVAGNFTGTKVVQVRVKATASALASQIQTINFTL